MMAETVICYNPLVMRLEAEAFERRLRGILRSSWFVWFGFSYCNSMNV